MRRRTGGSKARTPRGYRVDYAKLKTLCHQAGLTLIDLYEPGWLPKKLISEATLKKWRRGGRATVEKLDPIADALSERLHWRVEWRGLVQVDGTDVPVACRLIALPFQTTTSTTLGDDLTEGFRNAVVARLTKLRNLRLVAPRIDMNADGRLSQDGQAGESASAARDTTLRAVLREHGDNVRLDVELTDLRNGEILWAESYTFSGTDVLQAQSAIAADIAEWIRRRLSEP